MGALLVAGGRVVDPSQGLDGRYDVLVEDGAVARIDGKIAPPKGAETVEASGLVVTPGSGHSAFEAENIDALVAATDAFA